jgi:RiboL-PSP-HEPN
MAYQSHFAHADAIVAHLNGIVPTLADPLLEAKYVGFITVAAVTVFELAIKDIFIEFAKKKHKVLGNFTEKFFERINGRIRVREIQEKYLPNFGDKYVDQFKKHLNNATRTHLKSYKRDVLSSYGNVITWRNDFAHEGKINATATYAEAVQAYEDGKTVINCLAQAMVR